MKNYITLKKAIQFKIQYVVLLCLGILISNTSVADIVIIAHPEFAINEISNENIKKLWLGKTKKIAHVGRVFIIDQSEDNKINRVFYKQIMNKKHKQIKAYWAKIEFIGKGFPPKTVLDDAAVIEWVLQGPNRIGYIDKKSLSDNLKVLQTITGFD